MREQDKHFLSSLYIAIAVIFTWKGIWDSLYELPAVISSPFVWLFAGFTILTLSGLIFSEFDPFGGIQKAVRKTLHSINIHPQKEKFEIRYYDKKLKKKITLPAKWITKIEKGAIILIQPGQKKEMFLPIHRVSEVLYNGKLYWRL